MNKLKETLYQYRLLVIVVCLCIGLSAAYLIYNSFQNREETFVSHVKENTTIVEEETISVTKDELYTYFLQNNGLNLTLDAAINYIADLEITDEKLIKDKVDESIKEYKNYVDGDLNAYVKENGYKNLDAFKNEVIIPDAKIQLLQDKYATEHFNEIIEKYKAKYIKVMTFDTESQALKVIKQSKSMKDFDKAMKEHNGNDYGMVTKDTTFLDENIIKQLDQFTKDGTYSKAIKTSDSKYAIVYVYNSDSEKNKDEIIKELKNISNFSQDCETYYLKAYEFDVFEPIIKEKISEISADYFG